MEEDKLAKLDVEVSGGKFSEGHRSSGSSKIDSDHVVCDVGSE